MEGGREGEGGIEQEKAERERRREPMTLIKNAKLVEKISFKTTLQGGRMLAVGRPNAGCA